MNSTDLYLILKLDDIRSLLFSCCIFAPFVSVGLLLTCFVCVTEDIARRMVAPMFIVALATFFVFFPLCATARAIIPSTQQAAVIYIAPEIATVENLESIKVESRELYDLAKTWLAHQVEAQAGQ